MLNTDGARAYKLNLPNVKQCNVVHKKMRMNIGKKTAWHVITTVSMQIGSKNHTKSSCKVVWVQAHYTKVYHLKMDNGRKLAVKSGTQIIDPCWRHIREHIKNTTRQPGSEVLTRKIRSAQWVYRQKSKSLWSATAELVQYLQG